MSKHDDNKVKLNTESNRLFYTGLVIFVILMLCIASIGRYYRSNREHKYVIITTPDGNTIAGHTKSIYYNRNYAEITIDNITYTVSYDNFIAMTTP